MPSSTQTARLFPVLLIAAGFLCLFKIAGLVFGDIGDTGVVAARAQEKPQPAAPADATKTDTAVAKEDAGKPDAADATESSRPVSPTEARLLQRLAKRRQELDKRKKSLDLQENLLKAAEKKLAQQLKKLKAVNAKIQEAVTKREKKKATQLKNLVSMYENMKPKDAARIFNRLDLRVTIDVVEQMNTRKMAPILALMEGKAAQRLTLELAARARGRAAVSDKSALPKVKPDGAG